MKLEKRYVCPKCSWAVTGELRDLMKYTCPVCKNGRMVPVGTVGPDREFAWRVLAPQPIDSS